MKTIKQLQSEVNRISRELDRIDTPAKLRQAQAMIRENDNLAKSILEEAINLRSIADTKATVSELLGIK